MPLPAELLLPLFVLTLLANAILVGVAIRGIIRGQYDPDRRGGTGRSSDIGQEGPASGPNHTQRPIDPRQPVAAAPAPASVDVSFAVEAGPVAAPAPSADVPRNDPAPPTDAPPAPPPAAPRPKRRRAPTGPGADATAIKPTRTEPRRRRQRFSLPPLDDDHERVSRSIESFLSGADPATDSAEAVPAAGVTDGATTVAIVLVEGLPDGLTSGAPSRTGRSRRRASEPDPVADALAMVERTLRGAARGTDSVTVGDHGRFQIVLASTGELAARAYLRRIRAAIEPRLETADHALRLVVATATVLDEPAEAAVQRAEGRLAIALGASRSAHVEPRADPGRASDDVGDDEDADDDSTAPRAAAD